MCVCVCVCVCVWLGSSLLFKQFGLNDKDTFYLHNSLKIHSSFLISVLVSGWNSGMNLLNFSRVLSDLYDAIISVCSYVYRVFF